MAANFARPSGLNVDFFFGAGADFGAGAALVAGLTAPFLLAAHLAFIEAASFARPSGVSPPFFAAGAALAGAGALPFTLAQRACCAARILASDACENFLRPDFAGAAALGLIVEPPMI